MISLNSLLIRISFLVCLVLLVMVTVTAQVPKPSPTPVTPKSTVKGRVLYDDTNDPLRRSSISLMQLPERPGNFSAATDRNGKFEIRDVPAGVYFVLVDSPGIISPIAFLKIDEARGPEAFDSKEMNRYCTQVAVDGTNSIEMVVRARRGGAISGKVTYSDGIAAVNAQISLFKRKGNQTQRMLTGFNVGGLLSMHTDDRGKYRISGLPPGDYILSAAENNTGSNSNRSFDPFAQLLQNDALTSSYYSNGTKMAEATAVHVELGSEVTNIDITLADATPHVISGSCVVKNDGRRLANAVLKIRNKETGALFMPDQRQIQTDSEGEWFFPEVPDGSYIISVEPPYERATDQPLPVNDDENGERSLAPPRRKVLPKDIEVTVAGSDVVGLSIDLIEGSSISGTVEVVGPTGSERSYVAVNYAYEGESEGSSYRDSVTVLDGKFTIEPLKAGKINLTAQASAMGVGGTDAPKYYVKSISVNGKDLRGPLTLESGQAITNVKIVLSSDIATAKIQLIDSKQKAVPAKSLMIVPAESGKWSFASQRTIQVTDANGSVTFVGAPGEYLIIVPGESDSWPPSLEGIQAASATAARISLKSGENKTINIPIN